MTARALVVLAVLAAAAALGLWWRARNGRFTAVDATVLEQAHVTASEAHERATSTSADHARLEAAELGTGLGERATFVQFSSEVCSPCRRTHQVLTELAAEQPGVVHVDLDVTEHLDLVRRFGVLRTPTTLVLDARGAVVGRMSGGTDRRHALAALEAVPAVPASGCPDSCPGGATAR